MDDELFFCGDDMMQRSDYAYNLKKIILDCCSLPKSNDNASFVIGINAPWGTGKTHFVKMFQNYLKGNWEKPGLGEQERAEAINLTGIERRLSEGKIDTIYYDAWKNDFWDNAFEPLFDQLTKEELVYPEAEKKDIADILKSTAKIIALVMKGYAYKKIEDIIDTSALDDAIEEAKGLGKNAVSIDYQTKTLFPEYSAFKDAIESLKAYLRVTVKRHGGRLVIIIDELDRCKPTFAVQTLEIVKHIFDVEGLVFIFALDINQLSFCVKSVYGNDIDAVGYLERIFNYITILPRANIESVSKQYFQEFGIDVAEASEQNGIINIARDFGLSIRDFRTVLCSYLILRKTVLEEYSGIVNAKILYFYFLAMKYKHPGALTDAVFHNGTENLHNIIQAVPVPFEGDYDIDEEVLYNLCSYDRIEEMDFVLIKGNEARGNKHIESCKDGVICFEDGYTARIGTFTSLSNILYKPDILAFDEIKKLCPIEYIYRKLEMCEFSKEV